MKLNKYFDKSDKIYDIDWYHFLDRLDCYYPVKINDEYKTLIVLTGLYENNIISKEKLKGQLKSLREKALTKFKKTYHCTINNQWYNDEPFSNVLKDLYESEISFIKLIEVLQLYTNKNYNYCINLIVENILSPLLRYFSDHTSYRYFDDIFKTTLSDFPDIESEGTYSKCYCCGNNRFERSEELTFNLGLEKIKDFFHYYKKGNLTKIPRL